MKILVIDPSSYIQKDIVKALNAMVGSDCADVLQYTFKGKDVHNNSEYEEMFWKKTRDNSYDFVLSTNFYPVVARLCNEKGLKYLAWTYDTPMNVLPCDEMKYETNYIFLFDKLELKKYQDLGFERFYHMPLGVDTEKYSRIKANKRYAGDISFLGKLYRSKLPMVKYGLSTELIAYIDKIVNVQKNIFGKYVVDDFITQPILDEMNRQYKVSGTGLVINKEQLSYAISEYVTYLDRLGLLEVMGRRHDVHLYTYDIGDTEKSFLKSVKIHGPLQYDTEMPVMFKSVKINLSSSFRAARSAISLRALDILGCGGFLLSNAQPELEEYFDDRKEVVLFRSIDEAIELADYYLSHDDERKRIANAGFERVRRDFSYEDRLKAMFKIAGIDVQYI